jgi:hypothetical protein
MATRKQLEVLSTSDLGEGWSDAYKALNGFRPCYIPTREELIRFWSSFDEEFGLVQDQERAAEQRRRALLDAEIQKIREVMPNASQSDIMRFIAQSEDAINGEYIDWEMLDYTMGVKFGTCEKLAA